MRSWRELRLWVVACLALTGACAAPESDGVVSDCGEESALDWESFGDPFLRSWCTGCHSSLLAVEARAGAPVGVDFDSRETALSALDRIVERAAPDGATMPPAGGPSAGERALLRSWARCEAERAATR